MNRPHVLLSDDDVAQSQSMVEILKSHGYNAEWAASGESVMVWCESFKADALILDHLMPNMSGVEVLTRLRQLSGYQRTPAIILTAVGNDELATVEAAVQNLPPVVVLRKPCEIDTLLLKLSTMLEDARGLQP